MKKKKFKKIKLHPVTTYIILILGVILMSQGIPFIHAGQEFCGTKKGHHNSYMAPDHINNLDWTLMEKNHDIVQYVKDMISLRKQYSCLRLNTAQEIKDNTKVSFENDGITVYRVNCEKDSNEFKELVIIINPNNKVVSHSLNNYYTNSFDNHNYDRLKLFLNLDYLGLHLVPFF